MDEQRLSPLEAAVLVLIARGVSKPEAIADVLRVAPEEVERVIEELKARGLVEETEKRILFLRRRTLRLTKKGFDILPKALEVLKSIAEKARQAHEALRAGREATGGQGVVYPYYDLGGLLLAEELLVLPALVALGLLPATLLTDLGSVHHDNHSHEG